MNRRSVRLPLLLPASLLGLAVMGCGDGLIFPEDLRELGELELCAENPLIVPRFEDPYLEADVRLELVTSGVRILPQDDLSCSLVQGLTSLRNRTHPRPIESLVGVENLTGLTSVEIHGWQLDLGPLSGLTNLTHVRLGGPISDLRPLSPLANLTVLELDGVCNCDLGPLAGMRRLTRLSLQSNGITDISPLSELTSLTELNFQTNSISDIGALSRLTSLTSLNLHDNSVADIGALSGLVNLENLALSKAWDFGGESITDISVLSGMSQLKYLYLSFNSVTDLSALSGLPVLQEVHLYSNRDLSDIQPLLDNTGLGMGDRVGLNETNVDCADVAALAAKGVKVLSDCP